jgi:hypothetical protein
VYKQLFQSQHVLFLIEMNDVFCEVALWFVVLLSKLISSQNPATERGKPCGILKALGKITKQSLNSTEPKIAAPTS